ncbi:MAG: hypothetical protein H0U54_06665, partial [Acidobacteria bacterium]|nr:hypothetical protein [Acidobacteriota bacterium]
MIRLVSSRTISLFIAVLFLFASGVAAQEARAGAQPEISFTVSMSKPHTHLLEVEMRLRASRLPAQVNLVMPVWAPGSYLIREFGRHVQDFAAADAQGGALRWQKTDKNTWRIETNGAK